MELTGAGTATQLVITTQPSATAASGSTFAQQPAIEVQDAYGNPLSTDNGRAVTATVSAGGNLEGISSVDTSGGVATFSNLAISGATGDYTLTFSSGGVAAVVSRTVTLTGPGEASVLVITTQPSATAASGSAFTQQPVIEVQDAFGNPLNTDSGRNGDRYGQRGRDLVGSTSVATSGGVATFTNLGIGGLIDSANNPYTLTFSATGVSSANSNAVELTGSASATQLVMVTQPSGTIPSGSAFVQQPVIEVQDAYGNPVTTDNGREVTASVDKAGSLGGTTTVSSQDGRVSFLDLSLSGLIDGNPYTLTFSAPSLNTSVSSSPVVVTFGEARGLSILVAPSDSVASGSVFDRQPQAEVVDDAGNRVTDSSVLVEWSVPAGAALGGGSRSVQAQNGVATFQDVSLSGTAGSYVFSFSSAGITSVNATGTILTHGHRTSLPFFSNLHPKFPVGLPLNNNRSFIFMMSGAIL